jgi:UDP-N-acetylglucosamine 1-carboxyvinyltransferase
MAASVLCEGKTTLLNCPQIRDVQSMQELLQEMGSVVTHVDHRLCMDHSGMTCNACTKKAGDFRASILLLGSCLTRFGEAVLPYPGGCSIGSRPIDYHIQAFRTMGAAVEEYPDCIRCYCRHALRGTRLRLPFPSVGATENIILAAVLAEGKTEIMNAAREPEIIELCGFLRQAGAVIIGEGSSHVVIEGQKHLQAPSWELSGDRIVFFTFAMMVAGCGGEIVLKSKDLFGPKEREVWHELGGEEIRRKGAVTLRMKGSIRALRYLDTGPYPNFSTDGQSLLLAVLTKANGSSTIEEKIFENRFQMIRQLRKMGANIDYVSNRARISGVTRLHGAEVTAEDLRSGAGLLIAAAMADGTSRIEKTENIERGYEKIVEHMRQLGVSARYI